jgi:hypothetical protein
MKWKKWLALTGFIFTMAMICNVQAAEYYIDQAHYASSDSNPGTQDLPWETLQKANDTLQPGDTVYIRSGTYTGQTIQPSRSGTSDTLRIVYTSFPGDEVVVRDSTYGIRLNAKSFITVNGIKFINHNRFFRIASGHYNIISYCTFDQRSPSSTDWAGARIGAEEYVSSLDPDSEPSTHNWVHHCRFTRWMYGAYNENRGALLDIGNNLVAGDHSSYNLIEDNTFAYGGHHTLGVYSPFNVIRRNYFHNETNAVNWDYQGYRSSITEGSTAGRSLYEGNRYGDCETSGMSLRSAKNIFRFNLFYRSGQGGLQVVSNTADVDKADSNYIYHNTFYRNGHLATYANFQGGMYFANWSDQSPLENVVKNNIFFDNRNGAITYEGYIAPQIIENNWDQNDVDPGFMDLANGGPDDPTLPDLRLTAGSGAIDGGKALTTITSASGSGTIFTVEDAGCFMDGWGMPRVQGDLIQLLGSNQSVRITGVDYTSNTIEIDQALTWTQGQGVALAYDGAAPDLGAFEYGAASQPVGDGAPPAPGGDVIDDGGGGDTGGETGPTLHVSSITMELKQKGANVEVNAYVTISDGNGIVAKEVTVTGAWTHNGAAIGTVTTMTRGDGVARLYTGKVKAQTGSEFTLEVTAVSKDGYLYDSASNIEMQDSLIVP